MNDNLKECASPKRTETLETVLEALYQKRQELSSLIDFSRDTLAKLTGGSVKITMIDDSKKEESPEMIDRMMRLINDMNEMIHSIGDHINSISKRIS